MTGRNPFKTASRNRLGAFSLRTGSKPLVRTNGFLRYCPVAFVYVGVTRRGSVKIGMSAAPERRCGRLKIRLAYQHPVVPDAAKDVEARALAGLGVKSGEGEWAHTSVDQGIRAVQMAAVAVAKFRRVSPYISEDEARALRISLATDSEAA